MGSRYLRPPLDFVGTLGDRELLKDAGHFGVVAGMCNKSVEGRTNDLFLGGLRM
ncbi:hypothetical protein FHT70_000189 [Rhizobium sp. BK049]|uniref:hypothetical protein n=1 Tax=Rhizobium sp. BK049 TaxID=2587095 RepID=UPI0016168C0D|nr:hypothetical protein [Rhizobium sp. BK049]MBB3350288.1 hypothetical protein [Rhizobium sp. BK049]